MNISAIVMASGFSKRMGDNKLKLEVKGKRMFEYTVDLLDSLDFSEKILITNDEDIKNMLKES
ncbi:GTP:adenosylcobinamide-phosphate guanylyltransferase [Peptoniphilus indolicus]|uniref:GTP:adenosylcobinamide-phosphate guanylyltransferase n=1 Tax=Peptoniphilus indolicus TaxID=33030 RepID=A0A379DCP7_9FIRM|nr:GTP:adenosylcobinamide-phosphate guanylyltransferase [Peptoniphilus indolicus]